MPPTLPNAPEHPQDQVYKIMHGLWGMGQMMFTKYLVVVDDDVDGHNISEVLFRLCANTDPQRDSLFTKGPSDVLDHATGFKHPWPPLINMDEAVRRKIDALLDRVDSYRRFDSLALARLRSISGNLTSRRGRGLFPGCRFHTLSPRFGQSEHGQKL